MPADPDNSTMIGYLATLLLGGGGAAKLVTHEGRIKSLERSSAIKDAKVHDIAEKVTRLDERSERADEDRKTILAKLDRLLEKK